MIKLEKVNKYFYRHKKNQIHVINNTSVELKEKGLVSLLGPSGCGKTTLLNVIGGLDKINKGRIYVNGKKISKRPSFIVDRIRNSNIGYIFQDYNLVETMTVFDNVALALRINGIKNKKEIKARVDYVLEKVGMYKHRNRPVTALSGGERQRVGIARAIVKNPKIVIADEPTGNLDSKNTIEVMNIIKTISKNRLVILVTHERELAEFYSDRILEIEDGKIIKDRKNENDDALDYRLNNTIYLKDFDVQKKIGNDDVAISYYGDKHDKIDIKLVVKNGNIYIQSNKNNKIEVIDEDSGIELVNDHYKKITYDDNYEFDLESVSNPKYKTRYSSIFNPITSIINGLKKVRDYTLLKKVLLIGFFLSGAFIMYSISSMFGINQIDETKFIKYNKNYLTVVLKKIKPETLETFEKDENVNYALISNSVVSLSMPYDDYYQSSYLSESITGSLSSINMITKEDIIDGNYPEKENEIVIDQMVYDKLDETGTCRLIGISDSSKMIGRKLLLGNKKEYIIVGIVDLKSPSIYTFESEFVNIIYLSSSADEQGFTKSSTDANELQLVDYKMFAGDYWLRKGRHPENDYEVVIDYALKDTYKLNKTIDFKVNDRKLTVVGYYSSNTVSDKFFVNTNTIKYQLLSDKENLSIYVKDKDAAIEKYKEEYNIQDSYDYSKKEYLKEKEKTVKSTMKASAIFLIISLVEIYLMIRSSFLSRIKEIGILRAIGASKKNIASIFNAETFIIGFLSGLIGVVVSFMLLIPINAIIHALTNNPNITAVLPMAGAIILVILSTILTLIGGLIPSSKAAKQDPVLALRSE
jgi:ABC-type lipoprotein export system ATPase subunit